MGVLLVCSGIFLGLTYQSLHNIVLSSSEGRSFWTTLVGYSFSFAEALLFYGRLLIISLAPLAHDRRIIQLALLVDIMLLVLADVSDLFLLKGVYDSNEHTGIVLYVAADAIFALCATVAICTQDPVRMHILLWRSLAFWVLLYLPVTFWLAAFDPGRWSWVPIQLVCLAFALSPRCQDALRRRLALGLEARSSRSAAAGVAGLVGNCEPKEVMLQASARFRTVKLADLVFEELADNSPDPDLFSKTEPAKLRRCDAFVSHSWHDDADAKWAAMQRWRRSFIEEKDREPRVWIDKCCIDQRNIESDLRCLPIFLSGCRRMVVFCGPTYLSRLWCIVELFAFVHMGGKMKNIHFEPVMREGHEEEEEEDLSRIDASFDEFDAAQCTCFLPEDKARMLGIICESFGQLGGFNRAVREIFECSRSQLLRTASLSRELSLEEIVRRSRSDVGSRPSLSSSSTCSSSSAASAVESEASSSEEEPSSSEPSPSSRRPPLLRYLFGFLELGRSSAKPRPLRARSSGGGAGGGPAEAETESSDEESDDEDDEDEEKGENVAVH